MCVRDSPVPHVNAEVFVQPKQTGAMQIICTMTISETTIKQVNNLSLAFLLFFLPSFLPGNHEPLLRTVGQQRDVSGHAPLLALGSIFHRLAPDFVLPFFILLYGRRVLFHDNTQAISRFSCHISETRHVLLSSSKVKRRKNTFLLCSCLRTKYIYIYFFF